VLAHARKVGARGKAAHREWNRRYAQWRKANRDRAALLDRLVAGELPDGLQKALPEWDPDPKGLATRAASGKVLTALGSVLPELWGGSADLAESNNTTMGEQPSFLPTQWQTRQWQGGPFGRTLHFGVREFGMGCILNGIALEGLTRPYGGTFLIFSDYARPAVRLAALQQLPVTFVFTHDSIGLGEDGPTHQPIEHLAALRAIPGLDVVRPADANETAAAWLAILRNARPVALALSRQALPVIDRRMYAKARNVARGAYVLADAGPDGSQTPDVVIVATGSEVALALAARHDLERGGIRTRVVSMPCREWFEAQPRSYRERVLPLSVAARVSVEAATPFGWRDIVGDAGQVVGIDHFGASAAGPTLMTEFGFTTAAVVKAAKAALRTARSGDHHPGVTAGSARSPRQAARTDTTARRRPATKAAVSKED
jgi:transketolase